MGVHSGDDDFVNNIIIKLPQEFHKQALKKYKNKKSDGRQNANLWLLDIDEKIAKDLSHKALFITLTCPSRMHASFSSTGNRNPNYDNTTPKEAQNYLNKIWSRIRAALKRKDINFYGIRVAEPHHDGTPHWHFTLFSDKKDQQSLQQIFAKYALKSDPNENGADENRLKVVILDINKGNATGYISKYISKNTDGFKLDGDLLKSVPRVNAWASVWGIRQFQFYGNPPVSVWRELRRLKNNSQPKINDEINAAKEGNWAVFMELMSGPSIVKKLFPITLYRDNVIKLNQYGEEIIGKIKGVCHEGVNIITRIHEWTIKVKEGIKQTWSPINNCTFKDIEKFMF